MDNYFIVHIYYMWLNMDYMSGEHVTNNTVETQNLEGDLHSIQNPKNFFYSLIISKIIHYSSLMNN